MIKDIFSGYLGDGQFIIQTVRSVWAGAERQRD